MFIEHLLCAGDTMRHKTGKTDIDMNYGQKVI